MPGSRSGPPQPAAPTVQSSGSPRPRRHAELAWHRGQRRERQAARLLLGDQRAADLLARHHAYPHRHADTVRHGCSWRDWSNDWSCDWSHDWSRDDWSHDWFESESKETEGDESGVSEQEHNARGSELCARSNESELSEESKLYAESNESELCEGWNWSWDKGWYWYVHKGWYWFKDDGWHKAESDDESDEVSGVSDSEDDMHYTGDACDQSGDTGDEAIDNTTTLQWLLDARHYLDAVEKSFLKTLGEKEAVEQRALARSSVLKDAVDLHTRSMLEDPTGFCAGKSSIDPEARNQILAVVVSWMEDMNLEQERLELKQQGHRAAINALVFAFNFRKNARLNYLRRCLS